MAESVAVQPDADPPTVIEPRRSDAAADRAWWQTRLFALILIAASAIPLIYPPIPPLVDLLGHMGRYRVQLDIGQSELLQRYFEFHWAAIGNLGVDLLVIPLAPLIGLEAAVKLIILAIPPMTTAGFLWVAREVHGRIPPTALFALPFVYGHPFLFGFANYSLSIALAFLAFGLWLRLARLGRTRLRSWLFVPISIVVFFAHTFGWGVLGLLCFSAEAVRQHDRGASWLRSAVNAALHASVMALPLVFMLIWRSGAPAGSTTDWFNWEAKFMWFKTALRDRWEWFDFGCVLFVVAVLVESLRNPRLTFSRNLAFSGLVLLAGYLILPRIIFGSAYADMRLMPYVIAVFLLAVRFRGDDHGRLAQALAVIGLTFFLVRTGSTTVSLAMAANDHRAKLQALDHMPQGARVVSFNGMPCGKQWAMPRNSHLGAMVMVRRQGFSNDQWVVEGANLLEVKHPAAGVYASDPSQLVRPNGCFDGLHHTINHSLHHIPPGTFDYVWLLDPPPYDQRLLRGAQPVWRGPGSILYRLR